MRIFLLLLIFFFFSYTSASQGVKFISSEQLESQIKTSKVNLMVVNFWATWCAPCIEELPYFEAVNNQNGVKVILVSMDFPEEHEKVIKFVDKKKLQSTVFHLNVKDFDTFMRSISDGWSGAIPATLFIDANGKQYFHETAFTETTLNSTISKYLK